MTGTSPPDDLAPQPLTAAGKKPLTSPSFPKAANEWGCASSRFQGPNRASLILYVESYEGHVELSSRLPFSVENGARILPENACESVRLFTERRAKDIRVSWNRKLRKMKLGAEALRPKPRKIRGAAGLDRRGPELECARPRSKSL